MDNIRNCGLSAGDDLYAYLGCSKNAYQTDIRRGFRLWGIRYHPGKNRDSFDTFRKITNAYEVLGNEDMKDRFDRYGLAGLGWDAGFTFGEPMNVFNTFFRTYGGGDVVARFVSTANGAGWEGYDAVWSQLTSAMPKLTSGMSCCGDFGPSGGTTVPCTPSGAGASQNISAYGSAAGGGGGGGASYGRDSFYASALGNLNASGSRGGGSMRYTASEGTMKHQFMSDYRKRKDSFTRSNPNPAPTAAKATPPTTPLTHKNLGDLPMVEERETDALVDYAYIGMGMPAKEQALSEFRRCSTSRDSLAHYRSGPRPNAYELRAQQMVDQNTDMNAKGAFMESWMKKRPAIPEY